jgi:hypothetical protein
MKSKRRIALVLVAVIVAGLVLYVRSKANSPVDYDDITEHFKYGSIGSEPANGIPYWIFKVMPTIFADKLPGKGYESLGFIHEEGRDLPIGFSQRTVYINRVWLNCGVCHTGSVRESPGSKPHIYAGMPSNTVDLESLVRFLVTSVSDERFTVDRVMAEIDKIGKLGLVERLLYRYVAIPETQRRLIESGKRVAFLSRQPDWGPGRVDTFNPYKSIQFNFPMDKIGEDEIIGTTDLPSIWMQEPRKGMQLHWDGNNTSVEERNKSAALGAGVTPVTIDLGRIKRIEDWLLHLEPPAYPFGINQDLASSGQMLYRQHCSSCHGENGRNFTGPYVGHVDPIGQIGTDPHRLDSFTYTLAANQNTLYAGYPWRFTQFRKTFGYANMPLDGIWLRAPYLHNGSVPTLRDLLEPPENRPKVFYRGDDVYDKIKVGFRSDVPDENGRRFFKYDTTLIGNANAGHLYGATLPAKDKDAIVEFLKKF